MTLFLTTEHLVTISRNVIGPTLAIRDHGLLAAAAARPQASAFGEDAYPTLHHKAAALMQSLAGNHPLVDGNKRLTWAATRTFYAINDVALHHNPDGAFDLVMAVAQGDLHDIEKIAAVLAAWC